MSDSQFKILMESITLWGMAFYNKEVRLFYTLAILHALFHKLK